MLNTIIRVPQGVFLFRCFDRFGNLKWEAEARNVVTTQGKNDLLDKYLKGAAYTATWFVGLIDALGYIGAPAAADTAAAHANWAEAVAYTEATRPALTLGVVAAGSVDNSASKATFTINATKTIKGAFTQSTSAKAGTAGVLYNAALFSGGDRAVVNLDTLAVQETLTAV